MKTGVVNPALIVGLANRIRIAPQSDRRALIAELLAAIDEGADSPTRQPQGASNESALRELLQCDEVKSNPVASMRIARLLVNERDK